MAVNKVQYGTETLIDLTGDTASASDVMSGKTIHTADGVQKQGTFSLDTLLATQDLLIRQIMLALQNKASSSGSNILSFNLYQYLLTGSGSDKLTSNINTFINSGDDVLFSYSMAGGLYTTWMIANELMFQIVKYEGAPAGAAYGPLNLGLILVLHNGVAFFFKSIPASHLEVPVYEGNETSTKNVFLPNLTNDLKILYIDLLDFLSNLDADYYIDNDYYYFNTNDTVISYPTSDGYSEAVVLHGLIISFVILLVEMGFDYVSGDLIAVRCKAGQFKFSSSLPSTTPSTTYEDKTAFIAIDSDISPSSGSSFELFDLYQYLYDGTGAEQLTLSINTFINSGNDVNILYLTSEGLRSATILDELIFQIRGFVEAPMGLSYILENEKAILYKGTSYLFKNIPANKGQLSDGDYYFIADQTNDLKVMYIDLESYLSTGNMDLYLVNNAYYLNTSDTIIKYPFGDGYLLAKILIGLIISLLGELDTPNGFSSVLSSLIVVRARVGQFKFSSIPAQSLPSTTWSGLTAYIASDTDIKDPTSSLQLLDIKSLLLGDIEWPFELLEALVITTSDIPIKIVDNDGQLISTEWELGIASGMACKIYNYENSYEIDTEGSWVLLYKPITYENNKFVVGIDDTNILNDSYTLDATATSSDILLGKTAYVNSQKVIGTHVCETPTYDTPSISVSSSGLITASANGVSNTSQLSTQAATTITPNTQTQTAVASGKYTTGAVSVGPIPSNYVIPSGSIDITTNGTHSVSGKASVNVNVPAPTVTYDTPTINVSSGGLITASANGKSNTSQLSTQAAKTITPTKSLQTAVSSGVYTTGDIKVSAIPSDYIIPTGQGTAIQNGTFDVAQYETFLVNVPGGLPYATLLYNNDSVSISYTSTTAGTAKSITGITGITTYPMVVVIILNADTTKENLKFIRSVTVIGNINYAAGTVSVTRYGTQHYYNNSGTLTNLASTSYGVWGYTISTSSSGTLTIRGRCNGNYYTSLTGTYRVRVLGIKF